MRESYLTMLRLELAGGLGNQLFGYFAGKFLANLTESELVLDGDSIDLKRTKFDLNSFNIAQRVEYANHKTVLKRISRRAQEIIDFRTPNLSSRIRHSVGLIYDEGYEMNLRQIVESRKPKMTLRGYFQDPRYFLNLPQKDKDLNLANPSTWYASKLKQIQSEHTTAIHLRFGDFLENLESIGVLSVAYFANALETLQVHSHDRVLVISDDISRARELLRKIDSGTFSYLTIPEASDPAESLLLMSKAQAIVTANSTFSVWSGLLSAPGTEIIVPEIFHRGSNHRIANLPPTWKVIPSSWIDEGSL
jgi:hypothetical protein